MVDSGTIALAAAGVGGAYYLSARGGDSGGQQRRPGRIPLPTPGGSGGGLSPGLAATLAGGGLGGSGGGLGGLGEQLSGILGQQREQFAGILNQQQAGIGRVLEQQQQLLDNLGNIQPETPVVNVGGGSNSGGSSGGSGGGGSGRSAEPLSSTQRYRLQAAEKDIAPEARGGNVLLEAARGTGEAADAGLDALSQGPDYFADVIGGDGPEAFSTDGGLTGGAYESGQRVRQAAKAINPF